MKHTIYKTNIFKIESYFFYKNYVMIRHSTIIYN